MNDQTLEQLLELKEELLEREKDLENLKTRVLEVELEVKSFRSKIATFESYLAVKAESSKETLVDMRPTQNETQDTNKPTTQASQYLDLPLFGEIRQVVETEPENWGKLNELMNLIELEELKTKYIPYLRDKLHKKDSSVAWLSREKWIEPDKINHGDLLFKKVYLNSKRSSIDLTPHDLLDLLEFISGGFVEEIKITYVKGSLHTKRVTKLKRKGVILNTELTLRAGFEDSGLGVFIALFTCGVVKCKKIRVEDGLLSSNRDKDKTLTDISKEGAYVKSPVEFLSAHEKNDNPMEGLLGAAIELGHFERVWYWEPSPSSTFDNNHLSNHINFLSRMANLKTVNLFNSDITSRSIPLIIQLAKLEHIRTIHLNPEVFKNVSGLFDGNPLLVEKVTWEAPEGIWD